MRSEYRDGLKDGIGNVIDQIESEIDTIITHCKSGNYSMNEIVDELEELSDKLY